MKCISLWQPWASAIPLQLKRIETRGRATNIRGRIGIHAAKRWTASEREFAAARRRARDPLPDPLPLGALVGTAVLYDCRPVEDLLIAGVSDIEQMYGDYSNGRFGWLLAEIVPLSHPVPWSAKQGWFEVPDDAFPEHACAAPSMRVRAQGELAAWPFPSSTRFKLDGTPKQPAITERTA